MPITACAFDLDGTLVDSIHDLARAANLARADLGLVELSSDRVASFVGDGAASLVARVLADSSSAEYTGTAIQVEGMDRFNEHYRAGLSIARQFYPKVQETLHMLHERGMPLAIVTNKPERFTIPLLRELGVFEHFDVIVAGDSLPKKTCTGTATICRLATESRASRYADGGRLRKRHPCRSCRWMPSDCSELWLRQQYRIAGRRCGDSSL